jgi:hypothetical protein
MIIDFKPDPAAHCSPGQPEKVAKLGHNVIDNGVLAHTVEFPDSPEPKAEYETDVKLLDTLNVAAKGNAQKVAERDTQSLKVHNKTMNILLYATLVCQHDIKLINLSGFECTQAPEPATKPLTRNIKTIVKWTEQGTVRIILEKPEGSEKSRRERKAFIVKVYATADATTYIIGCVSFNANKLIVRNVPVNEARFYEVMIVNSAGSNELASKIKYLLYY